MAVTAAQMRRDADDMDARANKLERETREEVRHLRRTAVLTRRAAARLEQAERAQNAK